MLQNAPCKMLKKWGREEEKEKRMLKAKMAKVMGTTCKIYLA